MRSRFVSEESDRSRVPVAILSGFLGSGKTTLINALLSDPRMANTAVAVNEFGETPIDHHLIDHGDDKTVVLANGCLCCNLAGDMESAIMRVFSRRENGEVPKFERLIVEPSGLADPGPVATAILRQPILSRIFCLENLAATADATLLARQFYRFPELREQLRNAEVVIVTKSDLASESDVERVFSIVKSVNPVAEIKLGVRGRLEPHAFLSSRFMDPSAGENSIPGWIDKVTTRSHSAAHIDASVQTVSLSAASPLIWDEIEGWLRRLRIEYGSDLLRSKGLVNVHGNEGPVVLQSVEHVVSSPVVLSRWPSMDHRTRFIIIGQNLRIDDIKGSWAELAAAAA